MNSSRSFPLSKAFFLVCSLVCTLAHSQTKLPSGPVAWTDNKGRRITATFKAIEGDKVILDIAGKATPVPLATLSEESQKLAQSYQTQVRPVLAVPPGGSTPAPTAPPLAGNLTPQQVATVLLDAGSELTVLAAGRKVQISNAADIPAGAIQITDLAFGLRPVPGQPLPWQVLRQLPDLRSLSVNLDAAAALQPADLLPLKTLDKLTYLNFDGRKMMFQPDVLITVPGMPSVRSLSLDVDLFRPADLGKFTAKFPQTNSLYLKENARPGTVMGQALSTLTELKELRNIRITGGSFTVSSAAVLKKLRELSGLQLYAMDQVEWTEVAALSRIVTLDIDGGSALDDGALLELSRMKNLATLRLYDVTITDNGLAHLANAKNLTSLALTRLKNITNTGVLALQRALPKCEVITE